MTEAVIVSQDFTTADVEHRSTGDPDRIAASWARWMAQVGR